jgi:hypothetical protein
MTFDYSKPVAQLNMEELAGRQRGIKPSGGVLFARNGDGDEKTLARELVLDLFTPANWPGNLHMVTMPGVQWPLERKLLGAREDGWLRKARPRRTYFTSCENDRAIFFASVAQMPGLHTQGAEVKQITKYASFAERAVKTRYASLFFANVDDFMMHSGWDGGWDAAWLDYTGPLTVERLRIIKVFYERYVNSILIVTSLNGRFSDATVKAITRAGGHSQWLRQHLEGDVLHDVEYFDTSSMLQFAVRKFREWKCPLV